MIATWGLQKAVYAALNGVITGGVYDEIPPTGTSPYTVIGETTLVSDDTHTSEGSEETVTLHVWSDATSSKEAKDIMAEIDAVLHHATLTVTGATYRFGRLEFGEVRKDEAEATETWRHGVLRYRFNLEES